ncbi:hypothetical protein HZA33_04010 [Candidatus Pacearchaeota archaeon]|nr:hypothetical protein [Candidatus Pacearchaeota archaeon]
MRLIIDANILISALIKKESIIRRILSLPFIDFYLPDFALEEIEKHITYIIDKSKLKKEEIIELLSFLFNNIYIVNNKKFISFYDKAGDIVGSIDKKDIPYMALALSFLNDGIWTEDKHFEQQSKIRIWKTKKLVDLFIKK